MIVWTVGQRPTRRERLTDAAAALHFHFTVRLMGGHA